MGPGKPLIGIINERSLVNQYKTRVMVRYAPEINIKSPKVKSRFVKLLIANIKSALLKHEIGHRIEQHWSRLFIDLEHPEGLAILTRVFGIGHLCPVEASSSLDLDEIEAVIRGFYGPKAKGKKVCLRVKRAAGVEGSSKELEIKFGGILASYGDGVDLTNPGIQVRLDMSQDGVVYFSEKIQGTGGLPLGSQGRALCMISGGFDSAVAAWMMMKRGVALDFCLFNLGGQAYEESVRKVVKGLCDRWAYGINPRFTVVDFSQILQSIHDGAKTKYSQVVLKRAFYKCASLIAKQMKDCPAVVTGEAVGQVSSQTLHNLVAVEEAASLPILRPLVAFDKEEIIKLSREIGTYVLCSGIKEYCGINQRRPVTKCSVREAKREEESAVSFDLYESSVLNGKSSRISDSIDTSAGSQYYIDYIPEGAVVIDSRSEQQFRAWHFHGAIRVDIDSLDKARWDFDEAKTYVLYCPVGVETAVIAEKLQQMGLKAYSFKGGSSALVKYAQQQGLDW